ncbi:MAG TPA: glycosyltransferase family 1 protein [Actinomycetota bacterium]|nr:glycosyltransferase family 1 protein [Actinomycetota bacterium]
MIRVGVNLLWMVPGVVGGSETYTTRLLQGLAESDIRDPELEYRLFALPQFATAHPDLASHFEVSYAPVTGQWKSFRVAGENTWLARQTREQSIHVLHHAGGIVPIIRTGRTVLTLHDLQYLFYPEYFTRTKLIYLKTMVPRSAESARLILTPSEFTRRTVIERLNIDPSIVVTVPHGIAPRDDRVEDPDVRERFGIRGPFFLYPAATYPHKNHLVVIEALAQLQRTHPDASLVFTGPAAWKEWATAKQMEQRLAQEISHLGLGDSVKRLGYVPERDLAALYQEAIAVVFPSRFEGFGAPVLEGMSRGCAVVAANATAIPEVVGTCGILCSPDNAEEWAEAMRDLIEDEERRAQLGKAGRERARQFEWTRSAEILERSYRSVMETTL